MLLKKVEEALDLDINVIIKEIKKTPLCNFRYNVSIGSIALRSFDDYQYLTTRSNIIIDTLPYTTSSNHLLYGKEIETVSNKPLFITCNEKKIKVGYINKDRYLHLPDFLASQVLYINGNVIAVRSKMIIDFFKGEAKVFGHSEEITTPYYLFKSTFNYTPLADTLAEIIGVFDTWKRGLFKEVTNETLKYFLYPYVSLILYKNTKTTLYPSLIRPIVSVVIDKVKNEVMSIIEKYQDHTLRKLVEKIKEFNSSVDLPLIVY